MAVKGQAAKQEVMATILEAFGDNAFMYNDGKEVRVNCTENGEKVQIKIALTCAKVMVEAGADNAIPGAGIKKDNTSPFPEPLTATATADTIVEVTDEEKENVAKLMASLCL